MSNRAKETGQIDFLVGGGEMGRLIRSMDWSATPLGSVESWAQSLRTTVSLCLPTSFPMCIAWGPKHVMIYNDGYWPICGGKHPRSMGQNFSECWASAWPVIGEPFARALAGHASFIENTRMFLDRNGYLEETFFTFSFSPIRDETGGIGGILNPCHETTAEMLSARRVRALRDVAARTGNAKSVEDVYALTTQTLKDHDLDVPFALIYEQDASGHQARLIGSTGLEPGTKTWPDTLALEGSEQSRSVAEVFRSGSALQLDDVAGRLPPCAPYPEPPRTALLLPITPSGAERPTVLLVGISPRLPFNESYRNFFDLLAAGITAAVANARAYEGERKRAEALAEIDRAKTTFFSNVSHEFRTPLTLMLGPVEELLRRTDLASVAVDQLQVVNRNGLRLLRLVNTLLDFSRIEAGRVKAIYRPTDLAVLTAELSSAFRSAIERAGLKFIVDCDGLDEPAFVDHDMWEKIVFNLLSNAFKFTFEGEVRVSLHRVGTAAQLRVEDTGTGIPRAEMPRLFERFHRVENAMGRTHEGSGIGLALVQELVKLHGGSIAAESAVGEGTTFIVTLPFGSAHLPPDRIGEASTLAASGAGASPYVEEALRWLPDENHGVSNFASALPAYYETQLVTAVGMQRNEARRARVLVADDNADMRQYLVRLLADRYEAYAVVDGEAALATARTRPPDLIVTDVMMPRLDGLGLVRALRADSRTQNIPIMMLSARAGEESRIEGMAAGVDDYLTKPFSARELLARVDAHLQMARLRREAADVLQEADRRKDDFLALLSHELRTPLAAIRNAARVLMRRDTEPRTMRSASEILDRQVAHMARQVDDLLDVSRINRSKLVLHKDHVDLSRIVGQAAEVNRPLFETAGQELIVSLPPNRIYVHGDPVRLSQIADNLLTNACKFTDKGGRIRLTVAEDGAQAVISVRDTGIGLASAELSRIFDPFSQVDRSLERSRDGLGLGLSLVKSLVEMHDGAVEAHSTGVGQGSEFTIRLPLESGPLVPQAPEKASPLSMLAGRRVLVVDDNHDSADSLAMLLKAMGHEVDTAYDGLDAISRAETFQADVVLLDIGMPRLNGYDTARRIRESQHERDLMLVALTGWGNEEDRRRSAEAGFDAHLLKPVDLVALTNLLETAPD